MRGVAGLLAMEIALAIAARARRITRAVLRLEALHRRPGCNLRPVDREMLVRQQPTQLRMLHERGQKLPRHVCFKQTIAVLREHRRNPYRLVHAETNEPAVEQVVVELLHQLPLRADGIERLQQERPQQSLRRDRRPAAVRVRPGKFAVERRQHLVHDRPHQPQRVFGWDALLKVNIGKQFTHPLVQTPHRCLRQPTHTTNHIRSSLSGGFFSSLLELEFQPRITKALDKPDPDISEVLADVQAMLAKFDEAVNMFVNAAPLNPLYDDVARLRIVRAHLREVTPALKAGNLAKARKSFEAFEDGWFNIEDFVRAQSLDAYVAIETGMVQIEQALLMPDKPDVPAVMTLVGTVMNHYNAVVTEVQKEARNAQ